ncbi:MAG: SDR family NAD(P)-dependent oxidoreductase, partial [Ilumatobacteraceae bacterium]
EAMARRFAAKGARVSLVARSADSLDALAGELNGKAFAADLLDAAAVDALVPRIEDAAGPIDVLVNNAGVETSQWLHLDEPSRLREAITLNLEAPIILTRAVLPGMLSRGGGSLVYTSSLAGSAGFPGLAVYAATKAGVNNFVASLRLELRDTAVHLALVAAGPVDTRMWDVLEDQSDFEPMLRRLNALHLIPKKTPALLAKRTVRAVQRERRHVRVPRRQSPTYWLGEAPRRVTELALTRVRFVPPGAGSTE